MANKNESFFQALNRIFKSGPAIQRRIKGQNPKSSYSNQLMNANFGYRAGLPFGFGRENTPFSIQGAYGILDRMARYAEFQEMDYMPEVARAMDILAEETVGGDERGKCFHIYSENMEIKTSLEELFYDTLNVEFNLKHWTRNLIQNGDFFLYNEVQPDIGVVTATPIRVNEIEREEGYDVEDPFAVRFKWISRGNKYLENWQVSHFRLVNKDMFLPYGTSMLESSRRLWRQLVMYEDAMLTYRLVRSPERRVFYIDVGHVPPNEVPNYLESVRTALKSRGAVDRNTGKEDLRNNSLSMLDDYYIPVRGSESGTRIDTLGGGQHVTAIEDIEYIQAKLFAALQVPKPYLNYTENMSSKATLATMDVRFSRTISSLQKVVIAELNKLAMVHLYTKGFDGADLVDFELKLSNPSSVALQQKLELWAAKFDLAGTAKETRLVDENWIQKNILELSNDEIKEVIKGLRIDRLRDIELESIEPIDPDLSAPPKTTDSFNPLNYKPTGANVPKGENPNDFTKDQKPAERTPIGINKDDSLTLNGGSDNKYTISNIGADKSAPVKATPHLTRNRKNRVRRLGVGQGAANTAMPDFNAMLSPKNKYTKDISGLKTESVDLWAEERIENLKDTIDVNDYRLVIEPKLGKEMTSIFRRLESILKINKRNTSILKEIDSAVEEYETEKRLLTEVINYDNTSEEPIETIKEKTLAEVFNCDD